MTTQNQQRSHRGESDADVSSGRRLRGARDDTGVPPQVAGKTTRGSRVSEGEDYALARVPESDLHSTLDISLVRMGYSVTASDLLFGFTLGLYLSFTRAVIVSIAYSLIIALIAIPMGIMAVRERTSFGLTCRCTFGRNGSRLPTLVLAVVYAVFYGYLLSIAADVLPGRGTGWLLVKCIPLGLALLAISAAGFARGLRWAARIGIPLMVALVIVADVVTVIKVGGIGAIIHTPPMKAGALPVATLIGLGVAKWIAGATAAPDLMRFGRTNRTVYISTLAEFVAGNFLFNVLGLVLGLGLKSADLGVAFGIIGVTWLASVAIVVQSVSVQMNELYTASLSISSALNVRRWLTNAAVGIFGIVIAVYAVSQGVVASFLTFIGYVGYAVPAIAGIMIVDYFIVCRGKYPERLDQIRSVNWRALIGYLIAVGASVGIGLGTDDVLWRTLPLIGMAVYLLLSIKQTATSWGWRRRPQPQGSSALTSTGQLAEANTETT